jgi:hypothetical protein
MISQSDFSSIASNLSSLLDLILSQMTVITRNKKEHNTNRATKDEDVVGTGRKKKASQMQFLVTAFNCFDIFRENCFNCKPSAHIE